MDRGPCRASRPSAAPRTVRARGQEKGRSHRQPARGCPVLPEPFHASPENRSRGRPGRTHSCLVLRNGVNRSGEPPRSAKPTGWPASSEPPRRYVGPTRGRSTRRRGGSDDAGHPVGFADRGGSPDRLTPFLRTKQELSLIHISEPTRRTPISYAVFCLKKKKK